MDPSFTKFEGVLYDMPIRKFKAKNGKTVSVTQDNYTKDLSSFPNLGNVSFDSINIKETIIDDIPFPVTDKKWHFGMILHSKMTVYQDGCYEFSLNSDDGSALWIKDEKIIDNDGLHKMTEKKDTVHLKSGKYPIKLWYFQGMPDKYGLILDAKKLLAMDSCNSKIKIDNTQIIKAKEFVINAVQFDFSKSELNMLGEQELEKTVSIIKKDKPESITLIGHTDSKGDEEDNLQLAFKRAEFVANILRKKLGNMIVEFEIKSKGELAPIANNETEEGRAQNRRVDISYMYKK